MQTLPSFKRSMNKVGLHALGHSFFAHKYGSQSSKTARNDAAKTQYRIATAKKQQESRCMAAKMDASSQTRRPFKKAALPDLVCQPCSHTHLHARTQPPFCLSLSWAKHVFGRQLRGSVQATGRHLSRHAAGLASLWHWRHLHAGLAQAPCP